MRREYFSIFLPQTFITVTLYIAAIWYNILYIFIMHFQKIAPGTLGYYDIHSPNAWRFLNHPMKRQDNFRPKKFTRRGRISSKSRGHASLTLPKRSYFLIPGCPPFGTRGKKKLNNLSSRIPLGQPSRLAIDEAPIGSRVRLHDTRTKPSIARSDTEERVYKGFRGETRTTGRTLF